MPIMILPSPDNATTKVVSKILIHLHDDNDDNETCFLLDVIVVVTIELILVSALGYQTCFLDLIVLSYIVSILISYL